MATIAVITLWWALGGGAADSIEKLRSSQWKVRSEGFREASKLPPGNRPEGLRPALIGALERENALVATGAELDESFSAYYADLIQAVARLKDPRAAGALLGALGAGVTAADGLLALGAPAVEAAIERLRITESRRARRDTCNLLRRMAEAALSLDQQTRNRMEAALESCGR
jgi:hypothetical protein